MEIGLCSGIKAGGAFSGRKERQKNTRRESPFTPLQGQLLFELISARYEKKSIIVTSNKMPGEWGTVFGDAAAATASLDRLLHHCTPMLIQGESYRTRKFSRKIRE